jgi:hypothetical protein
MRNASITLILVLLCQLPLAAQTPTSKSVLGTVTSFNKDARTLDVKPDNGAPVPVKLLGNTVVQRIAPGQTNLANAVAIQPAEIAAGDRVLVTVGANGADALRVVVISATDIAKRDDADRQDWITRGISGVVASKAGAQILLQKAKSAGGDVQPAITVSDKTKFRRYSPDSVKFADAKLSKLDEISAGDQIRARGEKSSDGLKVNAEEIVFGTFLTKAGSVVSVDASTKEVTLKELGSGKSVTVRITPDSVIKQMPAATPLGDGGRGPAPAGGNLAQIIEKLPAGKLEDIKPGASIVVSSTKGSEPDKVTGITIVANADALIRMASTPSGRGGTLVFGAADGGGISVLGLQ